MSIQVEIAQKGLQWELPTHMLSSFFYSVEHIIPLSSEEYDEIKKSNSFTLFQPVSEGDILRFVEKSTGNVTRKIIKEVKEREFILAKLNGEKSIITEYKAYWNKEDLWDII